jgi:hypothetical protein
MARNDMLQGSFNLLVLKVLPRRRRVYDLTPQGLKQLATDEARWTAVTDAVQRVLRFA